MNLQHKKYYSNIANGLNKLKPARKRTAWWSLSECLGLAAMFVTLGIAVWSVDQAGWIRPSTSLLTLLFVSVLAGFLLVKTGLSDFFLHPLALLSGLAVIFCLGLILQPDPSLPARVTHLFSDLTTWWQAQVWGAPSPVTIHIALIFGYITWLIGYFATWALLKKSNPWIAVILGIIVVLINLNFWSSNKFYFFLVYVIAALVFLALVNYLNNRARLKTSTYSGSRSRPLYWLGVSACLIIVTVSVSWFNPGFRINAISSYARGHVPFKNDMEVYWQSFFAPVPGAGVPMLNHGGQQDLVFGGPLQLNDQVVFIINSPTGHYWTTQVYDLYSSTGWQTGETKTEDFSVNVFGKAPASSQDGNSLIYNLIPQVNTNVVPSAGEFIGASVPVEEEVLVPRVYTLNLADASSDKLLPPDLAAAAASIRSLRTSRRRTDTQIAALLPSGLKMESVNHLGSSIQSVTVSRLETEDRTVLAITTSQVLLQQKRVSVSVVTAPAPLPADLEAAGVGYPLWVTDRYLQLPATLPERVRDLAKTLAGSASTPYGQTQAIKEYLATLKYDLNISAPPQGDDGVDYFLFTSKAGYCNYFASAATVLLRSAGIPARMVVGFMPGEYDSNAHSYIIRDRDYHAWTQVYYPGQGWVDLDATPAAQTSINSTTDSGSTNMPAFIYPDFPAYDPGVSGQTAPKPQAQTNNLTNLIIFMSAYALLVLALTTWFQRSNRPHDKTDLYSRMVLLAGLAGLGPKSRQTELEFSRQLALAMPGQAETINRIAGAHMVARYGRESAGPQMVMEFRKTWPALRLALIKRILHLG
jgi:hypothetical protein